MWLEKQAPRSTRLQGLADFRADVGTTAAMTTRDKIPCSRLMLALTTPIPRSSVLRSRWRIQDGARVCPGESDHVRTLKQRLKLYGDIGDEEIPMLSTPRVDREESKNEGTGSGVKKGR